MLQKCAKCEKKQEISTERVRRWWRLVQIGRNVGSLMGKKRAKYEENKILL